MAVSESGGGGNSRHLSLGSRAYCLVEHLPTAAFLTSPEGCLCYANPQFLALLDLKLGSVCQRHLLDFVDSDDRERLERAMARVSKGTGACTTNLRVVRSDGCIRVVSMRLAGAFGDGDELSGYVGILEDVTSSVEAEQLRERLALALERTGDLVGVSDDTGHIAYMNPAAREHFGFVHRDLDEATTEVMFPPEAWELYYREIRPAILRGEAWSGEVSTYDASGKAVPVWLSVVGQAAPGGTVEWLATIGRDVSERHRREQELAHRATHDPLTGLPNRSLLLNDLELAIARSLRAGTPVGVLFLDLDNFKAVNDRLGHEAGDDILVEVARRIKGVVRPTDTVARLGGDEFVVLCDGVEGEDEARAIAQRVWLAIESSPMAVQGGKVSLTASVGVALSRGIGEHPEALLREADAAMYRAKQRGRSRIEVFDQSLRERANRQAELVHELSLAIAQGQIGVSYQPLVDLASGNVMGVEALAQWHHRQGGPLPPAAFIETAEESGLIVPLGLTVLREACRQGRRWDRALGCAAPRIHVNVSARQLSDSDFVPAVEDLLNRSGLRADRLCLEISESTLGEGAAGEAFEELRRAGVRLVVDGFGAGHSSLRFLRRFRVEMLKVHRSFVCGLGSNPEDSAIVAAVVTLAHTLGLRAIAVGVERRQQLEELRALGCDGAQGYLFAPPRSASALELQLARGFHNFN